MDFLKRNDQDDWSRYFVESKTVLESSENERFLRSEIKRKKSELVATAKRGLSLNSLFDEGRHSVMRRYIWEDFSLDREFGCDSTIISPSHVFVAQFKDVVIKKGCNTDQEIQLIPHKIPHMGVHKRIRRIAICAFHGIALSCDGTPYTWKLYNCGCSTLNEPNAVTGFGEDEKKIIQVAGGEQHALFLAKSGNVFQCSLSREVERNACDNRNQGPLLVKACAGVTRQIYSSPCAAYSVALLTDGTLVSWGFGVSGDFDPSPMRFVGGAKLAVSCVACGKNHLVVVARKESDGRGIVYTAGDNDLCQLGIGIGIRDGDRTHEMYPVEGLENDSIVQVAAGDYHSLVLSHDGFSMYGWGLAKDGQLGSNSESSKDVVSVPTKIDIPRNDDGRRSMVRQICAGANVSLCMMYDDGMFVWGLWGDKAIHSPTKFIFSDGQGAFLKPTEYIISYPHSLFLASRRPSTPPYMSDSSTAILASSGKKTDCPNSMNSTDSTFADSNNNNVNNVMAVDRAEQALNTAKLNIYRVSQEQDLSSLFIEYFIRRDTFLHLKNQTASNQSAPAGTGSRSGQENINSSETHDISACHFGDSPSKATGKGYNPLVMAFTGSTAWFAQAGSTSSSAEGNISCFAMTTPPSSGGNSGAYRLEKPIGSGEVNARDSNVETDQNWENVETYFGVEVLQEDVETGEVDKYVTVCPKSRLWVQRFRKNRAFKRIFVNDSWKTWVNMQISKNSEYRYLPPDTDNAVDATIMLKGCNHPEQRERNFKIICPSHTAKSLFDALQKLCNDEEQR